MRPRASGAMTVDAMRSRTTSGLQGHAERREISVRHAAHAADRRRLGGRNGETLNGEAHRVAKILEHWRLTS